MKSGDKIIQERSQSGSEMGRVTLDQGSLTASKGKAVDN